MVFISKLSYVNNTFTHSTRQELLVLWLVVNGIMCIGTLNSVQNRNRDTELFLQS